MSLFKNLFGKPKDPLTDLLLETNVQATEVLAKTWGWLIGKETQTLHFSACGDVFFTDSTDAVYWLRTMEGKFTKLADSVSSFEILLKQPSFREQVLQPQRVAKMHSQLGPLTALR